MAIIIHSKDQNLDWSRINLYPNQYVPQSEKDTDDWVKHNMDYFANVSYSQFIKNKETFVHNYNLVKGILRMEDFYERNDPETKSFTDQLMKDVDLPSHVRHYSILNPPLNTMVGEQSRRPDLVRVKAYDDDSQNEQLQYLTDITNQYILQQAKKDIIARNAMKGGEPIPDDQIDQITQEELQDQLISYTSQAEKWASHILRALKIEFNMKGISEDCFRDLLITSREFYHIFEDNTKTGFGVENVNPKNFWYLTLPDKEYISDITGRSMNSFACGIVQVMELSEIIQRFDLEKDEIDHLRYGIKELSMFSPRESNFENPNVTGWNSIKYDTYSPLIVQERLIMESQLKENVDILGNDWLGLSTNVNTFGNKYIVVQAYWCSKIKVGEVTYVDEHGQQQTTLVDETYKKSPNQVGAVKWGWANQWYKGLKVGTDIYKVERFDLLSYCPIIGAIHEVKNVDQPKSLIDLLKPYQTIYNVCMNQIFKLLEKEIGNVYQSSIRSVPIPKDGDGQDALEIYEEEARRRGIFFVDDSPENLKSPNSFNQFKNVDLTRTSEIESRYNLATQMKNEAWELVGITRQRLGGTAGATETATATQSGLTQSYAQTEPLFAKHEYVLNNVYQAIIDAAQYIEKQKPESTVNYVSDQGEDAFIRVTAEDISTRDFKVFPTSSAEDVRIFEKLQELGGPMLQAGADIYDVSVLYTENSIRQMKQIFKDLKQKKEEMQQQQMQAEQDQAKQEQETAQAQMQFDAQQKALDRQDEDYNKQLDRVNKKEVAIIQTFSGKNTDNERDDNGNGIPDILEISRLSADERATQMDNNVKVKALQQKSFESLAKLGMEREKLAVEKQKAANDLKIQNLKLKEARAKAAAAKKKPKSK